jgi:uroporphyrinogen III methyltransferase/synthase
VVEAYRTIVPPAARESLRRALARKPHWITFTSSSTVKNLLSLADRDSLAGIRFASIGPVTSDTARRHGLAIDAEAAHFTIDGVIEAISAAEQTAPTVQG